MKDNSGIKESCRLIDGVISFIEEHVTEADIRNVISDLEKIRKINRDLRKWGNEKYDILKEICDIANYAL